MGLNFISNKSTKYFLLHFIFNSWVTYYVFLDAIQIMINPLENFISNQYSLSGIITTLGILSFHLNHLLFYSNLNIEDLIHHFVSAILLPIIGVFLPYGNVMSLSNLTMCGIPGGIDYLLLFLVKQNYLGKLTEKKINRFLNLLIRWPIMFLSAYIFLINSYHNNVQTDYIVIMNILLGLHCINAVYYCDKVIGNYYQQFCK